MTKRLTTGKLFLSSLQFSTCTKIAYNFIFYKNVKHSEHGYAGKIIFTNIHVQHKLLACLCICFEFKKSMCFCTGGGKPPPPPKPILGTGAR